jgi:hypothetical protein
MSSTASTRPLVAQVAQHEQLGRSAERHQRDELAVVDEDRQCPLGGDGDAAFGAELVEDGDLARERRGRVGEAGHPRMLLLRPLRFRLRGGLTLGGLTAVAGGECAPDASMGLESAGAAATKGPGSVQAGVATGGLVSRLAALAVL